MRAAPPAPGADDITVLRAPLATADRYRQQSRDWASATSHVVHGCSVQLLVAVEDVEQREYTTTRLRVWAPAAADVLATDRIQWNGNTYEVDGDPFPWRDDVGTADHLEFVMKRWVG